MDGDDRGGGQTRDLPLPAAVLAAGRLIEANEPFSELVDRPPAELLDRPLADLVEPFDPPDLSVVADLALGRLADGAGSGGVTVSVRHPDGAAGVAIVRMQSRARPDGTVLVVGHDVTEEYRANALLDALADSTIVIDPQGLVTWQSLRLRARIPRERGDGTGINPMERVHPEDLPRVLESFARAVEQPGAFDRYVVRSRAPEVDDLWQSIELTGVSAVGQPLIGGVVVAVRNLDEGEVVTAVSRAGRDYQSLADAAPIGIVVDDRQGRTVYRNPQASRLLGQGTELHQGDEWRRVADPEYRAVLDAMVAAAVERRSVGHTVAAFRPSGVGTRWLRVTVAPQLADGPDGDTPVGVIASLEDVTAEVHARAQADRLTQMLDATSDYVAVFRPSSEILYLNEATKDAIRRLRRADPDAGLADLLDQAANPGLVDEVLGVLADSDLWRGEITLKVDVDRRVPVSALAVGRRNRAGALEWIAVLARDISGLKEAESQLRHLATRDTLTGLANRSLGNDRLEQAVARHRRTGRGVAVLFCDLDGFKAINDAYGHAAGDQVLAEVAHRLLGVTRSADTLARVGGDEFVVVCEGLTDREQLAELADRIIGALKEPFALDGIDPVTVGISVGVAVVDDHDRAVNADRLLIRADAAMYRAKAHGGNGYRIVSAAP